MTRSMMLVVTLGIIVGLMACTQPQTPQGPVNLPELKNIEGSILELDNAVPTITINKMDGDRQVYRVGPNANIIINGQAGDWSALAVGQKVAVEVNETLITKISVIAEPVQVETEGEQTDQAEEAASELQSEASDTAESLKTVPADKGHKPKINVSMGKDKTKAPSSN
ncbi:hypothetical protein JXQ70_16830 [bacterium]|nr:hypothetical protein [bacterium]